MGTFLEKNKKYAIFLTYLGLFIVMMGTELFCMLLAETAKMMEGIKIQGILIKNGMI